MFQVILRVKTIWHLTFRDRFVGIYGEAIFTVKLFKKTLHQPDPNSAEPQSIYGLFEATIQSGRKL